MSSRSKRILEMAQRINCNRITNNTLVPINDPNEESCDDLIADPDYLPDNILSENIEEQGKNYSTDSVSISLSQMENSTYNVPDESSENIGNIKNNQNNENIENGDTNIFLAKSTTKTEKPKKRQTNTEKVQHYKTKYPLLPANCTCLKKCKERVDQSAREHTYNTFIKMNFSERRLFLDKYVTQNKVKVKSQKENAKVRNYTLTYTLEQLATSESINETTTFNYTTTIVCKNMCLSTLGRKHDGFIISHFKSKSKNNGLAFTVDKRGEIRRSQLVQIKEDIDARIRAHIESFNPVVSHYRLSNAPNRRYLTPDLSVKLLWQDFIEKNTKLVSYETYRKIFIHANIGFTTPSEDDCPTCSLRKNHLENIGEIPNNIVHNSNSGCSTSVFSSENIHDENICEICVKYEKHHTKYTLARQSYEHDKNKTWNPNYNVYTVDMQKVMIIPKMTIKNSYFVSRLVVFNETFASLHGSKDVCVLWNEYITGRRATDVASTYYSIIKKSNSEVNRFIFWADNCSGQNKNWLLFTTFVCIVNQIWGPDSIVMKYFESGHSYMRADSIHGKIGTEWKRRPEVLTMDDMEDVILKSSSNNSILRMNFNDFRIFKNGTRIRSKNDRDGRIIPNMEQIKVVEFRKGYREMYYKESHSDGDFKKSIFLKHKFDIKQHPTSLEREIGLNTLKKQKIIKELVPHMPLRKQLFWHEMPENDLAKDLCFNQDADI